MAMSSSIKSAPARLRRTFQYQTDDSSANDSADVMDEDEQESLIATLAAQDARRNAHFRRALFVLPALAAVPYLIELFVMPARRGASSPPGYSSSQERPPALFSLLALTSLASTTYLLWKLPPTETGIAVLDAWSNSKDSAAGSGKGGGARSRRGGYSATGGNDGYYHANDDGDNDDNDAARAGPSSSSSAGGRPQRVPLKPSSIGIGGVGFQHHQHDHPQQAYRSPLETWLPYLNAALCLLVVLMGVVSSSSDDGSGSSSDGPDGDADNAAWSRGAFIGLGNLPAVVFAVVLLAKTVMAGVDPERELSGLRYEYKGA